MDNCVFRRDLKVSIFSYIAPFKSRAVAKCFTEAIKHKNTCRHEHNKAEIMSHKGSQCVQMEEVRMELVRRRGKSVVNVL